MEKIKPGDVFQDKYGDSVVVLEYNDSKNVAIQYQDKAAYTYSVYAYDLRRGAVRNPYRRSVFNIGYIG